MSEDSNHKSHKKRKVKQKPVLEQVPAPQQQQQTEDGNSRFARALGSTDYGTREKGLQALSRFLVHKDTLSELDMMKLWKGLFFCFWHSDKVPVQTELAERLAGLLQQVQPAMAQLYWAGLLATLRREWGAMDHHRLDKFLMLVRKFVGALLARLQAAQWDGAAISGLTMQLPMGQSLLPLGTAKSLGLSYHLADVWLSELRRLAGEQAVPHDPMLLLLEPFVAVLERSGEQALVNRIKEAVFEVLIADLAEAAAGEAEQQDCLYCSKLDVSQLAGQLFDRGAAEGVKSRNRQALYSISKDLERVAGKRRKLASAAAAAGNEEQRDGKKEKKAENKKRLHEQQQQQQQQEAQLVQQASEQQEVPSAKKSKKKQKQAEQQQEQPVANGVSPSSSKKRKQLSEQQQLQQAEAAATPIAAAVSVGAAAATPRTTEKSGKKKRKHSDANAAATPAGATTPAAAAAAAKVPAVTPTASASSAQRKAAAAAAAASASKKGVKIDLRKNVYFAHGAPVPPEEVRSPPNTKPKGSALKTVSRLSKHKSSSSPAAPATAPAKQQQGSRLPEGQLPSSARKAVTPKSVPRVKAAAFF